MSIKLPDIDGEWELITETVSDIAYGETTRRYKRIPPKEKGLYELVIPDKVARVDDYFNRAQLDALNVVCQTIEALEKRVGFIEKSCSCNACKLERFK